MWRQIMTLRQINRYRWNWKLTLNEVLVVSRRIFNALWVWNIVFAVLGVKKSIIVSVIWRTLSRKSNCWSKLHILAVSSLNHDRSLSLHWKTWSCRCFNPTIKALKIYLVVLIYLVYFWEKETVNLLDFVYSFCLLFVEYLTKVVKMKAVFSCVYTYLYINCLHIM